MNEALEALEALDSASQINQVKHFSITRRIEIDAAHRVPDHGSKCRHVHGHRYVIEACVRGPLYLSGVQAGMVLDFGFLKDLMVKVIHDPCDHGIILYHKDPVVDVLVKGKPIIPGFVGALGQRADFPYLKMYLLDGPPTAEVLAAHWYKHLRMEVHAFTQGQATLQYLDVHETPNCVARYPHEHK